MRDEAVGLVKEHGLLLASRAHLARLLLARALALLGLYMLGLVVVDDDFCRMLHVIWDAGIEASVSVFEIARVISTLSSQWSWNTTAKSSS